MNQDSVLQIIKTRGPVIPSQISKDLGTNILLASAILSDFASRNLVKVSSIKIGGSPLYYITGQEDKLQQYMDRLQEKEKKACDLLKEMKILRDEKLEPVDRYSLRQCKDFAKPIEVTIDGKKELFWKWYLAQNEEIEALIRKELLQTEKKQPEQKKPEAEKIQIETPRASNGIRQAIQEKIQERTQEKIQPQAQTQNVKEEEKPGKGFSQRVQTFFSEKSISISEEQPAKKGEISCILKVPSSVGELTYYCTAKNKAKCNEADLSYAYVCGQQKQLPVLFITTGELTKKAKELLQSGTLKNLIHIKV
ncbi:hypothetical protein HY640_01105 [Candidatus Woesearchaeota archaeon]|nr:hypothetical protein [Candidatus Woesearchaeota archaeon]